MNPDYISHLPASLRDISDTITHVECDYCGKQVRLRQDGKVGLHRYTQRGRKVECEHSGRAYSFHTGSFRAIERDANRHATLWLCECRCGETKTGPTHQAVEAWWESHSGAARADSSEVTR